MDEGGRVELASGKSGYGGIEARSARSSAGARTRQRPATRVALRANPDEPITTDDFEEVHLLFCYGSNNPEQLVRRIGEVASMKRAFAPLHKRVFCGWSSRWEGGVASLEKSRERPAYGFVAEVTESQLKRMDAYEGVGGGSYLRVTIPVIVEDEAEMAVAYIASPDMMALHCEPSPEYLHAIAVTVGTFWKIDGVEDIEIEFPKDSTHVFDSDYFRQYSARKHAEDLQRRRVEIYKERRRRHLQRKHHRRDPRY